MNPGLQAVVAVAAVVVSINAKKIIYFLFTPIKSTLFLFRIKYFLTQISLYHG